LCPKILTVIFLLFTTCSCGVHDDRFECINLCNESRRCSPSMSDPLWDECYADCEIAGHSQQLVDCVIDQNCKTSLERMIESCYFDPMNPND